MSASDVRPAICLLAILLVNASAARADCVAHSREPRARLVELYTSEGCSSCPPADDWLRRTPHGGSIAALEFHVDYWDSLGWRDRFATAAYSARQVQQARRDGGTGVYTPQVVLDGHNWSGWYRGGEAPPAADAGASMRIAITPGSPVHVHVDTQLDAVADVASFRNYLALTEDGLSSQVRAGENRGSTLRHDHVVRAFAGPLPLAADADLAVPADLDTAHAAVVAFAQRASDGAIAQVLTCTLR